MTESVLFDEHDIMYPATILANFRLLPTFEIMQNPHLEKDEWRNLGEPSGRPRILSLSKSI